MKNVLLLDDHFFPRGLKTRIEAFVEHFHYQRYLEFLDNVAPADVYTGQNVLILHERDRIKERMMK